MVMVTLDIPKEINKRIEHFKVDNDRLKKLFRMADKTKRHNLTPEQIKAMDKKI